MGLFQSEWMFLCIRIDGVAVLHMVVTIETLRSILGSLAIARVDLYRRQRKGQILDSGLFIISSTLSGLLVAQSFWNCCLESHQQALSLANKVTTFLLRHE